MMENPYDEDVKWIAESLEAAKKYRDEIKRELADLEKVLAGIPRWKLRERKRINRKINGWNYELQIVEVNINSYSWDLGKVKKKRDALEYVRGKK